MRFLRFILIALAAGSTLLATGATVSKYGIPSVQNPQGVSLKKESVGRTRGFFMPGRTHYGGGMRSHK